jgi:DNA-binding Lrp family transcriptional regulator
LIFHTNYACTDNPALVLALTRHPANIPYNGLVLKLLYESRMKRVKLDHIDLVILNEMQKDGRITNVDLAEKAGISAPPCLRRVRALEQAGFIRGYHADIAPDKMGFGLTVFIHVGLANHSESDLAHFTKLVDSWPQVRESYMLTGDSDFLLKVVSEDWESFQKFLTTQLTTAPNVMHVKSAPAMRRTKFEAGVPIDTKSMVGPSDKSNTSPTNK